MRYFSRASSNESFLSLLFPITGIPHLNRVRIYPCKSREKLPTHIRELGPALTLFTGSILGFNPQKSTEFAITRSESLMDFGVRGQFGWEILLIDGDQRAAQIGQELLSGFEADARFFAHQ